MLLVEPPDRGQMLRVLSGFLDGDYTREELVSWRDGIVAEHGEINLPVADGFWYFESLAGLLIPFRLEPEDEFFVRERDMREYLLDLQGVGGDQRYEGITRVRSHQTDSEALRWPLLMFDQPDIKRLDELGLPPVRGIFDAHRDLVEHCHLYFEGELYVIVRQYDDRAHQLMVNGTSRDEDRLRRFLEILGFA